MRRFPRSTTCGWRASAWVVHCWRYRRRPFSWRRVLAREESLLIRGPPSHGSILLVTTLWGTRFGMELKVFLALPHLTFSILATTCRTSRPCRCLPWLCTSREGQNSNCQPKIMSSRWTRSADTAWHSRRLRTIFRSSEMSSSKISVLCSITWRVASVSSRTSVTRIASARARHSSFLDDVKFCKFL